MVRNTKLSALIVALMAAVTAGCGGSGDSGLDPDTGTCTTGTDCPSGICLDGRCVPVAADADADVPVEGDAGADADPDVDSSVEVETGSDADADADADADPDGDGGGSLTDSDGDTIPDDVEGWTDADGDTIPNALDDDSDGDDIPDAVEAADSDLRTPPPDSDRDGIPDFLDLDSDGDTILDSEEWLVDTDGDTIPAYRDFDSDGDGIFDSQEAGDSDPATPPVDSDGDGTPDYLDLDSDNDTISDAHESIADTDLDGIPDYLDRDSDADGISDADEAGDTDLATPPVNCDGDALPNFRDTDSDNDGVRDYDEIMIHHTDPCMADTDGDGVTDLIEISYGSPPLDPTDSPRTRGDFVFIEWYMDDPDPWQDTLVFSTNIQQADVYFMMDTTGSMGSSVASLKASLSSTIIPAVAAAIPSAWYGVGGFEDYQNDSCGYGYSSSGDQAYYQFQMMTSSASTAQTAVNRYVTHYGGDGPESDVPALYAMATGLGDGRYIGTRPACPAGGGTVGYPCFRAGAVPIVILITDIDFHNGPGGANPYSNSCLGITTPTYTQTVTALNAINAKVIGVAQGGGGISHLRSIATDTGAVSGGSPLVYTVSGTISTAIVTGIQAVATNIPIRADTQFVDDGADAVNTQTEFLDYLETNTSGASIWDPATSTTRVCTSLATADSNGDGHPDYFPSLLPGTSVCWDIHVKRNITVAATADAQIFRATINVIGDLFTPLDSRDIYFLVPPVIEGSQ